MSAPRLAASGRSGGQHTLRVGRIERDLNLALVAACPARDIIIVPGAV